MKNILISQRIILDKFNQIHFSLENKWINYLEKKKHKYSTNFYYF